MKNKLHYITELGKGIREKDYTKIKNICSEMKAISMIDEETETRILNRYRIFEG